jgi:hypothetical protein
VRGGRRHRSIRHLRGGNISVGGARRTVGYAKGERANQKGAQTAERPSVLGLLNQPSVGLLLADFDDDVHASGCVVRGGPEGVDPDGELLVRRGVARHLEVVDVAPIDLAH